MSEMLLSFGNRVANGTLSGGASFSTMPLTNLQVRQLGILWRSTNLSPSSTTFDMFMPTGNAVKVWALANHNMSLGAKIRVRASDDPAFTETDDVVIPGVGADAGSPMGLLLILTTPGVLPGEDVVIPGVHSLYDSGWVDVWPSVYSTEDLEWEADNFWLGQYLEEDLEGYMRTFCLVLPQTVDANYWRVEIDDQLNPTPYVQAGRLFMAPAWQPIYNANYGATLGWNTNTEVSEALSGAEYFDVRTPFRVAQFKFDAMTENEGLSGPFEIMRRMGIDGEVLFMWDPADLVNAPRRNFLGRLRTLSPLEFPEGFIRGNQLTGSHRTSVPMEIKESVA